MEYDWDLFVCEETLCLEVDVGDQKTREGERPRVHTRSWLKRAGEKSTVWRRRQVEVRKKR